MRESGTKYPKISIRISTTLGFGTEKQQYIILIPKNQKKNLGVAVVAYARYYVKTNIANPVYKQKICVLKTTFL